jgi:signal transduction histidine kinase
MHFFLNRYKPNAFSWVALFTFLSLSAAAQKPPQQEDTLYIQSLQKKALALISKNPEEALQYTQEALELSQKLEYTQGLAKAYNQMGLIARMQGDFEEALDYFWEALKYSESINDSRLTAQTLNGIGATQLRLGRYTSALNSFNKVLKIREAARDSLGIAVSYSNLGDVYVEMGKYDLAKEYHQRAIGINIRFENADFNHYSFYALGKIAFEIGDYTEALRYQEEALRIRLNTDNQYEVARSYEALASIRLGQSKLEQAESYLQKSLDIAKALQAKSIEKDLYLLFSELFQRRQAFDKALSYYKKYSFLKDSLFDTEKNRQINQLQIRFQNSENEKTNILLDNQLRRQRNITVFVILGLVAAIVFASVLYREYQLKLRANRLLTRQKEEIAEQRDKLAAARQEVENTNEELRALNHHLEEVVSERTKHLQQAYEELKQTNQELDLFVYRASHDFRGPLATLMGLVQAAALDTQDPQILFYFQKVEYTAYKLSRMLSKLLMVNAISHKAMELSEVSLKSVLSEALQELPPTLASEQFEIQEHFSENLHFFSDAYFLRIIFYNLIENTVVFRNPHAPKSTLHIRAAPEGQYLQLVFEQEGGMPVEAVVRTRLFEMFFRGSEKSQGNGLGLYIVKKSVERLSGDIQVETVSQGGLRFLIQLPLVQAMA